jgi:hypothetical protein
MHYFDSNGELYKGTNLQKREIKLANGEWIIENQKNSVPSTASNNEYIDLRNGQLVSISEAFTQPSYDGTSGELLDTGGVLKPYYAPEYWALTQQIMPSMLPIFVNSIKRREGL